MMEHRDANAGTYWRLAWSHDWKGAHPWSLGGKVTPYLGVSVSGGVRIIAIGPIGIISLTIRQRMEPKE